MPRNNADFHGITFNHHISGDKKTTLITATHPKEGLIGAVEFNAGWKDKTKNYVRDIYVKRAFRRKGIATGMWNYATTLGISPHHSSERTALGEVFARGIGGPGSEHSWMTEDKEELSKLVERDLQEETENNDRILEQIPRRIKEIRGEQ